MGVSFQESSTRSQQAFKPATAATIEHACNRLNFYSMLQALCLMVNEASTACAVAEKVLSTHRWDMYRRWSRIRIVIMNILGPVCWHTNSHQ